MEEKRRARTVRDKQLCDGLIERGLKAIELHLKARRWDPAHDHINYVQMEIEQIEAEDILAEISLHDLGLGPTITGHLEKHFGIYYAAELEGMDKKTFLSCPHLSDRSFKKVRSCYRELGVKWPLD